MDIKGEGICLNTESFININSMKIDLSKTGYQSFLKDWQIPLFTRILSTEDKITSSQAHRWLLEQEDEELHRSRTLVIFFLQELAEEGILTKEEDTGKGGAREVFQRVTDLNGVLTKMDERCRFIFSNLRAGV